MPETDEATTNPYPATETNREKLQQYLLDYYSSSTFNIEHQILPLMDSPPMRLMINPHATPTAHHSPIPVPLHWQDDVKAGLDRDMRLGVLKPVPFGEPVTWCHHMVGHLRKKEWHAQKDNRLPTSQHPCHQRDTTHPVTLPPGAIGPSREEENRLRCMEWLPQCTPSP